jgi:hypothetical protein
MAQRIGNVLYWIGCIAAGLTVLMAIGIYFADGMKKDTLIVTGFLCVLAVIPWAIGRACLYILSAPKM